jgi:hypothetical protein
MHSITSFKLKLAMDQESTNRISRDKAHSVTYASVARVSCHSSPSEPPSAAEIVSLVQVTIEEQHGVKTGLKPV